MQKKIFMPVLFLISALFLFLSCERSKLLKIGVAGSMSGMHSSLGVYARNGVVLATEEQNSLGGINGRRIELVIKDDGNRIESALKVHDELVNAGVVAIIGHMTSEITLAVIPQANKNKIVMISPTASTSAFSEIDDYFFRVVSPMKKGILAMADYAYNKAGARKLLIIYDRVNVAYSEEWLSNFAGFCDDREDARLTSIPFTSGVGFNYFEFAGRVMSLKPDAVILVAADFDAAQFCQQIRKIDSKTHIFASSWSISDNFVQQAGSAAENVVSFHWFIKDSLPEAAKIFNAKYRARFGSEPSFSSNFGYESAQVLFTALSKNSNPGKLRETILETASFPGTMGTFSIDRFGDPVRDVFVVKVKNGKIIEAE